MMIRYLRNGVVHRPLQLYLFGEVKRLACSRPFFFTSDIITGERGNLLSTVDVVDPKIAPHGSGPGARFSMCGPACGGYLARPQAIDWVHELRHGLHGSQDGRYEDEGE